MQENTFKNIYSENFNVKKYWRNIDKQILAGFTLLFILGIFFSFSSTSILADERLDREYYSFFQKHFLYAVMSFVVMIFISAIKYKLVNKFILPFFLIFFFTLALVPFLELKLKEQKGG